MKLSKLLLIIVALVLLLIGSLFVRDLYLNSGSKKPSSVETNDYNTLLQYEWPQLQGDSSFTRFSAGPAPETCDFLWKTNITGI